MYKVLRKQFDDGSKVVYRAGAIIMYGSEVLWIKEHDSSRGGSRVIGKYGFPKGAARGEKNTLETARARVLAETGINLNMKYAEQSIFSTSHIAGGYRTRIFYHLFRYPVDGPRPQVNPSADIASYRWLPFDETASMLGLVAEPTKQVVLALAWCTDLTV